MTPPVLLMALSAVAWGVAVAGSPMAQGREVDRGVLVVMRGSTIVSREEFVLRRGGGAGDAPGFTVVTTAVYPPQRPVRSIEAAIEFGEDSLLSASRRESGDGEGKRVLIGVGQRRVTVRSATAGRESAREYPAAPPPLLLDDSIFAVHALPPALGTLRFQAITLDGRRGPAVSVSDHGVATTSVGDQEMRLRHLSVRSSTGTRSLWYDSEGRIMKVEDPASGTVVLRIQDRGLSGATPPRE